MESLEPIINYLVDPNSGLKQVITICPIVPYIEVP
jgi:hypothetical protein